MAAAELGLAAQPRPSVVGPWGLAPHPLKSLEEFAHHLLYHIGKHSAKPPNPK